MAIFCRQEIDYNFYNSLILYESILLLKLGWCDKIHGSTIPVNNARPNRNLTFTKREPVGLVKMIFNSENQLFITLYYCVPFSLLFPVSAVWLLRGSEYYFLKFRNFGNKIKPFSYNSAIP